jgi:hypothetical protein
MKTDENIPILCQFFFNFKIREKKEDFRLEFYRVSEIFFWVKMTLGKRDENG